MRLGVPIVLSIAALLGASSAQSQTEAAAAGPGFVFSGLQVSYDSPPFPTTRYHVTTTLSGEVCGDPLTGTWTITFAKSGYPSELPPRMTTKVFATANPATITGDRWLDASQNEIARVDFLLRLTPGGAPTLTPEWQVSGDIQNIAASPTQMTATATTLAGCPAAQPPPPPPPPPPLPGPTGNAPVTGGPTPGRTPGTVKVPGSSTFVTVQAGQSLPSGTIVDVSNGKGIRLTDRSGNVLDIYGEKDGVPSMAKIVRASGLVELQLAGGNFKACGKRVTAVAGKVEKPVRRLWAKGKGKFRTKGRFISATIRGTWWETRDFCDRSGVRVKEGSVLATNLITKQKKVVPKGKIYSVPKP